MKRQKNRRRAAVLVGCILLACIACVRLVTAYGVLRPSRPPEQLRLSAGKEWTGAVKLEEFGGLCWDATQQEVQDALAFCNSCTQFPREEEGALMLGMGATFRQLVLEMRMDMANYLLEETSLSMEQIAEQLGYSSVNAFYLAYRKIAGFPPGQKRKKSRENS